MKRATLISVFFFGFLSLIVGACAAFLPPAAKYGLNPDYDAFVPSRVAVLDCALAPQNFRLPFQGLNNIQDADLTDRLKACDGFVLEGFANQPYMRGFTPKAIKGLLEQTKALELLTTKFNTWRIDSHGRNSDQCQDFASLYTAHIQNNPEWQKWLRDFSLATRFSDTLLLPLITQVNEDQVDSRGVFYSSRSITLDLFLVDTSSAKLIWSAHRQASLSASRYPNDQHKGFAPYPDWKLLDDKLLQESLWRDFPGRIER